MKKPLILLFSLLLTASVVVLLGWQALVGIMVLCLGTLLLSTGSPQVRALEDDGAQHEEAASLSSASGAASPDNAFDNGGWYYPMVEIGPILAANETDFDKPGKSVPQMGIGTA